MLSVTLRQLEYVVAVAHFEGVSAGAAAPNVAQPSISVAIAQVEREIGKIVPTSSGRERNIVGTNTGTPIEIEDTLNFSLLQDVRAAIEKVPFEQAPKAYAKMLANEARFQTVIEMKTAA